MSDGDVNGPSLKMTNYQAEFLKSDGIYTQFMFNPSQVPYSQQPSSIFDGSGNFNNFNCTTSQFQNFQSFANGSVLNCPSNPYFASTPQFYGLPSVPGGCLTMPVLTSVSNLSTSASLFINEANSPSFLPMDASNRSNLNESPRLITSNSSANSTNLKPKRPYKKRDKNNPRSPNTNQSPKIEATGSIADLKVVKSETYGGDPSTSGAPSFTYAPNNAAGSNVGDSDPYCAAQSNVIDFFAAGVVAASHSGNGMPSGYTNTLLPPGLSQQFGLEQDETLKILKERILKHPIFPFVTIMFQKCELATSTSRDSNSTSENNICSATSYTDDLEEFRKSLSLSETDYKPDPEIDSLMISAVRVFQGQIQELEKVHELCDNFCERYVKTLKSKMPMDLVTDDQRGMTPSTPQQQSSSGQIQSAPNHHIHQQQQLVSSHPQQQQQQHQFDIPQDSTVSTSKESPSLDCTLTPNAMHMQYGGIGCYGIQSALLPEHSVASTMPQQQQQMEATSVFNEYVPSGSQIPAVSTIQNEPQSEIKLSESRKNTTRDLNGNNRTDISEMNCLHGDRQLTELDVNEPGKYDRTPKDGSTISATITDYDDNVKNTTGVRHRIISTSDMTEATQRYDGSVSPHSSLSPNGSADFGSGSKRKVPKVFSKEAITKFRSWLFHNLTHPYPTEDQKRQLAQDTGLTMLQVNNWFINARRRIVQPMIDQNNRSGRTRNVNVFKNRRRKDSNDQSPLPSRQSPEPLSTQPSLSYSPDYEHTSSTFIGANLLNSLPANNLIDSTAAGSVDYQTAAVVAASTMFDGNANAGFPTISPTQFASFMPTAANTMINAIYCGGTATGMNVANTMGALAPLPPVSGISSWFDSAFLNVAPDCVNGGNETPNSIIK